MTIASKPASKEYRDNFEATFGKKVGVAQVPCAKVVDMTIKFAQHPDRYDPNAVEGVRELRAKAQKSVVAPMAFEELPARERAEQSFTKYRRLVACHGAGARIDQSQIDACVLQYAQAVADIREADVREHPTLAVPLRPNMIGDIVKLWLRTSGTDCVVKGLRPSGVVCVSDLPKLAEYIQQALQ
jgi:hypothetical protein